MPYVRANDRVTTISSPDSTQRPAVSCRTFTAASGPLRPISVRLYLVPPCSIRTTGDWRNGLAVAAAPIRYPVAASCSLVIFEASKLTCRCEPR